MEEGGGSWRSGLWERGRSLTTLAGDSVLRARWKLVDEAAQALVRPSTPFCCDRTWRQTKLVAKEVRQSMEEDDWTSQIGRWESIWK